MTRTSDLPLALLLTACSVLAGCAGERPQSTTTPSLETGITSSSGGGTSTLGNQPNIGVTTRVGPAQ